jgi:integrase
MTPGLSAVIDRARSLRRPIGSFFVITSRKGTPYTEDGFRSAWQRMMAEAIKQGLIQEKFTFHDIRAKHLTDRDEQELNAQLAGGHTDPSITARYIRNRKGRRYKPLQSEIVEGS